MSTIIISYNLRVQSGSVLDVLKARMSLLEPVLNFGLCCCINGIVYITDGMSVFCHNANKSQISIILICTLGWVR